MNKYQKALDNLVHCKSETKCKECIHKDRCTMARDYKILKELVDKETSKRVFKESLQDTLCVKCGAYVNFDMLNDKIEHAPKYCSNCGQKLDWAKVSDE